MRNGLVDPHESASDGIIGNDKSIGKDERVKYQFASNFGSMLCWFRFKAQFVDPEIIIRVYHRQPMQKLVAVLLVVILSGKVLASDRLTLFMKVNVFDGISGELLPGQHVLVWGNLIDKISNEPIPVPRSANVAIYA